MLVLEIAAGILLALIIVEMADELTKLMARLTVLVVLCSPLVILFAKEYLVAGVLYMCALVIGIAVYAFVRTNRTTSVTSRL